jgi:hypothetical protein
MARAGLWSALAFVLNLVWEIAQVRLYTIWAAADGMSVAWAHGRMGAWAHGHIGTAAPWAMS